MNARNQKRVDLIRPEFLSSREYEAFRPDESFDKAFGDVSSADLLDVGQSIRNAINWSWIQWHLTHKFGWVKDLKRVCHRSSENVLKVRNPTESDDRGFHDQMMLHAAVLTGDLATMKAAASSAAYATSAQHENQYYAALAGIISSRLLGNHTNELKQLHILERCDQEDAPHAHHHRLAPV
jgi:hypothetical protein